MSSEQWFSAGILRVREGSVAEKYSSCHRLVPVHGRRLWYMLSPTLPTATRRWRDSLSTRRVISLEQPRMAAAAGRDACSNWGRNLGEDGTRAWSIRSRMAATEASLARQ